MRNGSAEKRLLEYNHIIKESDNIYRGMAKKFRLSECALWILYSLRIEKRALSQSEICNAMYQPKQTVNSALKNLETDGCIELLHINDHRSKQIRLTAKGTTLAEHTADQIILAEQNAMSDLSEPEQALFISLLQKYTAALKQKMNEIEVQ